MAGNYLGSSNLNALLDYQVDLMREQRLYEHQEFLEDASVISKMVDVYKTTESIAMKQHITDTMKKYWDYVDPQVKPMMEPILRGSPLDEEREKIDYFNKNVPIPRRPVKIQDEPESNFMQRVAEYHYSSYLRDRQFQKYMGVGASDMPLKKSFPIGSDENGKMLYVVKHDDTPARIVTGDALELAKIAKEKDIPPSTLINDPTIRSGASIFEQGGKKFAYWTEDDLLTNDRRVALRELDVPPEREDLKYVPRPQGYELFKASILSKYDPDAINMLAKPDASMQLYKTAHERAQNIIKTVGEGEVAKPRVEAMLRQLYPGWFFKLEPGGKMTKKNPFGENPVIKEAPGEVYFAQDNKNISGLGEGSMLGFVYDPYNDVVYDSDLDPIGSLAYVEHWLGSQLVEGSKMRRQQ